MPHLIEGRVIAEKVYTDLRAEIAELKKRGLPPGLAVVLVGDNPASRAYVRSKDKMCRDLGLHSVKLELPAETTQTELLARVEELNRDPAIHGILVQSPPPKQIDEAAIVRALDPRRMLTAFIRSTSRNSPWAMRADLFPAPRWVVSDYFSKAESKFPARTWLSSAAA